MRSNSLLPQLESWLFFLVLLFLPTQLGKHFWPEFAAVYSLPIDYFSPTVYLWDLLLLGLIIVWIIRLLSQEKSYALSLSSRLLIIFLISSGISLVVANNPGAGVVRLLQYLLVGFFGFYLSQLSWTQISTELPRPLTIAFGGELLLSMLQFFHNGSIGLWILGERSFRITTPAIAKFNFLGVEMLRPYATFSHPNVLAGYIVIITSLLSAFLGSTRKIWQLVLAFFSSTSLLMTSSRPAIVVHFVVLFWRLKTHFKAFALTLFVVLLPFLFVRFGSLVSYDSLSVTRREDLAYASWQLVSSSPVFGVGLNNFISAAASLPMISGESRFLQPVHTIFLLQLAETGIVGFLGFIGLVGVPIYKLWKNRTDAFAKVLLGCWGSLLFLGLFDHYFLTLPQGLRLLFLLWGLSFARLRSLRYD